MASSTIPHARVVRTRELITEPWDRAWQRRCADPRSQARVRLWAQADPELAPFTTLEEVLAEAGHDPAAERADEVLAAVVRRATDDEVAAEVVLRRLLPGLLAIALRRGRSQPGRARTLFHELTAAGWIVVRTYPIERRPRRVALNLLLDAEYQVCVRPFRRRSAEELILPSFADATVVTDAQGRDLAAGLHPSDELATLLAGGRLRGLPADDIDLLRSLYLRGERVDAVASRLGVTPRTVLTRRKSATSRLRDTAAA